eukprot:TRINITY_DN4827_c0_g1_i1.p1 TRINITY_DN4827_c0_g1~~TRINITY_DN4827_c0_g1_i1.p1  ORF type:complete len:389 (+),score=86.99 TRINITY_DN4827_c0_g1_i1:307-1473(+)
MGNTQTKETASSHPPTQISKLTAGINKEEIKEVIEFDPSSHKIVSLYDLFIGEEDAVKEVDKLLKQRGWCFVNYTDPSTHVDEARSNLSYKSPILSAEALKDITEFFERDEEKKKSYLNILGDGYTNNAPHKEAIHLVTGSWVVDSQEKIEENLKSFTSGLDYLATTLFDSFFAKVLEIDSEAFSKRADLPVQFGEHKGMLDIAHYRNNKTSQSNPSWGENIDEVNCVPHFDPGLFSLSFLSTNEGLQLFDFETSTWFAGPINSKTGQENIGILWLGDKAVSASEGRWKPAIHRVVYPRNERSRITSWYEVCTVDQINSSGIDARREYRATQLSNVENSEKVVIEGEGKDSLFVRIEREFGIPQSKAMMPRDEREESGIKTKLRRLFY